MLATARWSTFFWLSHGKARQRNGSVRVCAKTLCIGNPMRGLDKIFAVWSRLGANRSYRPERHYVRGPGPKTLAMIGRRYRAETAEETREPLPEQWLALIHSIDEQEKKRCRDDQANER